MLALLLAALALGLSNFAAAIAIGVSGADAATRWRVGLVFGLFEAGMPILGLALGRGLAGTLGSAAHGIGGALLIATGGWTVWQALRDNAEEHGGKAVGQTWSRLVISGLALSLDNLAVGFSLGAYRVGLAAAALVIGTVSVALSLIGLELGARIGIAAGRHGEILGGVVLAAVGAAIAGGVL